MEPRTLESRGPQERPQGGSAGQPTVGRARQAAVLETPRRGCRTPPGSASGAGRHRGNAGTWESPWSPGGPAGGGVPPREGQPPGVARRRPPRPGAWRAHGTHSQRRDPRERGRPGRPARPRGGPWAVCAAPRPAGREHGMPGRAGGAPPSPGTPGRAGAAGDHASGRALWASRRAPPPSPGHARAWRTRPHALPRWGATTGCTCSPTTACGQPLG
jgi:hypothetical protein